MLTGILIRGLAVAFFVLKPLTPCNIFAPYASIFLQTIHFFITQNLKFLLYENTCDLSARRCHLVWNRL